MEKKGDGIPRIRFKNKTEQRKAISHWKHAALKAGIEVRKSSLSRDEKTRMYTEIASEVNKRLKKIKEARIDEWYEGEYNEFEDEE
jgi:hypothetical protein